MHNLPLLKLNCTILFTFLSCLFALGQKDCVLRKDEDSIKVYTCAAENLKFKTIKAAFTVNTELSRLAAFVLDVENYVHWQYNTIQVRTIEKVNDHEVIYYTEIAAPWPVSNRDMITRISIVQDPGTKIVTITTKSVPGLIPPKENLVRVPMSLGIWTVVPISSSHLEVSYLMQIDPGGSVPAWLINMVSAQAPYESFKNLKEKIHNMPSKKIEVPFITD